MNLLFRNRQFRLLIAGSSISDAGAMTFFMVLPWLALELTDSPFWVGATSGAMGIGLLCFSLPGGLLADLANRRNIIVASDVVRGLGVAVMAVLIFAGRAEIWHVMAIAFLEAAVVSARIPAFSALVLDTVGRDNLLKALSATYVVEGGIGIGAPLAAGLIVSTYGIGWAFILVAGAYLAGAASMSRVHPPPRPRRVEKSSPWSDLKEGVSYVVRAPAVRILLLVAVMVEVFGFSHEPMLAVMARDVLKVGATGLGYLFSAGAVGWVSMSLVLSLVGGAQPRGGFVALGVGGFGLGLVIFAASQWFPLSLIIYAGAFAMMVLYEATSRTLIQTMVPDELRGRVLGFQSLTWGMTGLAGFQTGAIATVVGAPIAIGFGGAVVVGTAMLLLVTKAADRMHAAAAATAADSS